MYRGVVFVEGEEPREGVACLACGCFACLACLACLGTAALCAAALCLGTAALCAALCAAALCLGTAALGAALCAALCLGTAALCAALASRAAGSECGLLGRRDGVDHVDGRAVLDVAVAVEFHYGSHFLASLFVEEDGSRAVDRVLVVGVEGDDLAAYHGLRRVTTKEGGHLCGRLFFIRHHHRGCAFL